jgi:hypothetical protein
LVELDVDVGGVLADVAWVDGGAAGVAIGAGDVYVCWLADTELVVELELRVLGCLPRVDAVRWCVAWRCARWVGRPGCAFLCATNAEFLAAAWSMVCEVVILPEEALVTFVEVARDPVGLTAS